MMYLIEGIQIDVTFQFGAIRSRNNGVIHVSTSELHMIIQDMTVNKLE